MQAKFLTIPFNYLNRACSPFEPVECNLAVLQFLSLCSTSVLSRIQFSLYFPSLRLKDILALTLDPGPHKASENLCFETIFKLLFWTENIYNHFCVKHFISNTFYNFSKQFLSQFLLRAKFRRCVWPMKSLDPCQRAWLDTKEVVTSKSRKFVF